MAEPQESITTVSGRRCTRSRRADAPATSALPAAPVTTADPPAPTPIADPPAASSQAAAPPQNNQPDPQPPPQQAAPPVAPIPAPQAPPPPPAAASNNGNLPPAQPSVANPNGDPNRGAPQQSDVAPPANAASTAPAAPVVTNVPAPAPAASNGLIPNSGTPGEQISPISSANEPVVSGAALPPDSPAPPVAVLPPQVSAQALPNSPAGQDNAPQVAAQDISPGGGAAQAQNPAPARPEQPPVVSASAVESPQEAPVTANQAPPAASANIAPPAATTAAAVVPVPAADSAPPASEVAASSLGPTGVPIVAAESLVPSQNSPALSSQAATSLLLSSVSDFSATALSERQSITAQPDQTANSRGSRPTSITGGSFAPGIRPIPSSNEETAEQLTTAIAAGVVGGVVGIALIVFIVFVCMRRKGKSRSRRKSQEAREKRSNGQDDASSITQKSLFNRLKSGVVGILRPEPRFDMAEPRSGRPEVASTAQRGMASHRRSMSAPAKGFRGKFNGLMVGVTDRFGRRQRTSTIASPPTSPFPEHTPSAPTNPFLDPVQPKRLNVTNPEYSLPPQDRQSKLSFGFGRDPPARTLSADSIRPTTLTVPARIKDPFGDAGWTPEHFKTAPRQHSRRKSCAEAPLKSNPPHLSRGSSVYSEATAPSISHFDFDTLQDPFNPFADLTNPLGDSLASKRITRTPSIHILPDSNRTSADSATISQVSGAPPPPSIMRKPSQKGPRDTVAASDFTIATNTNSEFAYDAATPSHPSLISHPSLLPTALAPAAHPAAPARLKSGLSTFDFVGSPGPSRPTTGYNMNPRGLKGKSDPFDLDRPEVLGLSEDGSERGSMVFDKVKAFEQVQQQRGSGLVGVGKVNVGTPNLSVPANANGLPRSKRASRLGDTSPGGEWGQAL